MTRLSAIESFLELVSFGITNHICTRKLSLNRLHQSHAGTRTKIHRDKQHELINFN